MCPNVPKCAFKCDLHRTGQVVTPECQPLLNVTFEMSGPDIRMSESVRRMSDECRPCSGPGSYMGMSDVTFEMSDVTFHNVRRWHFTTAQIWNVTFAKMSENVRKCQEMSGIFCYEMWHSVYNRYLNVTFCISPYPHRMRCNILLRNTVGVYVKTVPP